MPRHLRYAFALIMAVLTLISPQARAYATPACTPLRGLVLQATDVPHSFLRARVGVSSVRENAFADGVPASTLLKHGYIATYAANFIHPAATTGMHTIDSEVTAYRGSAGARWEYGLFARTSRRQVATMHPQNVHVLALPGLGERRIGLFITQKLGKFGTLTMGLVALQRGSYWGGVTVLGEGRFSENVVRRYARLIDQRITGAQGIGCSHSS